MAISNPAIAELFSIPESNWTTINKRVGFILRVDWLNQNNLQFNISWPDDDALQKLNAICGGDPLILPMQGLNGSDLSVTSWSVGCNCTTLLPECQLWATKTYQTLSNLCMEIYNYAGDAISTFQNLQKEILAANKVLTPPIRTDIVNAMTGLKNSTEDLSQSTVQVMQDLRSFLAAHQKMDSFLESNSYLFELIHFSQLQPNALAAFEQAVEQAIGGFQAVADDLAKMIVTPDSITNGYVENMDIDNALRDWKNIQDEANGFMAFADDQKQYWDYI